MPSSNTGPASNGVFLCSKGCRRLDRHFEHESTPPNGVFLCSKLCLHTSSTKACPNRCVFVLEVLLPPRRPRNNASNGVFLCSKGCRRLDTTSNTKAQPRMVCFGARSLASIMTPTSSMKARPNGYIFVFDAPLRHFPFQHDHEEGTVVVKSLACGSAKLST